MIFFPPIKSFITSILTIFIITTIPISTNASSSESEFDRLQKILEKYGFSVVLKIPPQAGTYGLLQTETRTIWINPVVFDLEIAQPTLVHEAVHAAQLCASPKQIKPIGLNLEYPKIAFRYFMRYSGDRRQIEAEAYTVQVREDNVDYVINLLNSHCKV